MYAHMGAHPHMHTHTGTHPHTLTHTCTHIPARIIDELSLLYSKEQSTKVKNYSVEILSVLVQDAESLSQEVMDTILVNILEPNKVTNLKNMHSQQCRVQSLLS